jgi:biopolymer transport protein ExbB
MSRHPRFQMEGGKLLMVLRALRRVLAACLIAAMPCVTAQAQTPAAPAEAGPVPAAPSANESTDGVKPSQMPQAQAPTASPAEAPPGSAAPSPNESADSAAPGSSDSVSLLPRDLTPWGMFLAADIVVKVVMIGLAAASLITWTIALAKGLELALARRRLRRASLTLRNATSLAEATRQLGDRPALAALVGAAIGELRLSADLADKSGVKERLALRLERIEAAAGRRMTRGTGLLATIGATAPFIGLFGTVWGIMNSFIGISRLHTTNLAVVAPGIAEALLATALGLVAAIPAVVIYNMFSRSIAAYRALHADATVEVLRLVSRDLDREAGGPVAKGRSLSAAE